MHFVLNAGGKEECRGGPGTGIGDIVVAEGKRPESIDGQEGVVRILQESEEFVGEAIERRDPSAAEVSYQDRIAELAEVTRSPDDSPRRIKPRAMLQVSDVLAGGS